MIYVGIDNGITGAIAWFNTETNKINVVKPPIITEQDYTIKKQETSYILYSPLKIILSNIVKEAIIFKNIESDDELNKNIKIFIERPLRTNQAFLLYSVINAAMSWYAYRSIFCELGLKYTVIDSKSWQREMLPSNVWKEKINLTGRKSIKADRTKLKQESRRISQELYGNMLDESLFKDDGITDALLICEFNKRHNGVYKNEK